MTDRPRLRQEEDPNSRRQDRRYKKREISRLEEQMIPIKKKQQKLNKPIYAAAGYTWLHEQLLKTASDQIGMYQRLASPFYRRFIGEQSAKRAEALNNYKQATKDLCDVGIEIELYEKGMEILASQENHNRRDVDKIYGILYFYKEVYTEQMQKICRENGVSSKDQEMMERLIESSEDAAQSVEERIDAWKRQTERGLPSHPQDAEPPRKRTAAPEGLQQAIESFRQNVVSQLDFLMVWHGADQAIRSNLQNLIDPVQRKLQHISPLRKTLERISTTLLKKPVRKDLSHCSDLTHVEEFGACYDEVTRILKSANDSLLGKNIYKSAQDRLQDTGEKAHRTLSQMSKRLEREIPKVQKKLDQTLENTKRYLRSKLLDKTLETFDAIRDVRAYWESHKEEMRESLSRDQYEDIEYCLIAISIEYFEERVEFSPSSPTGHTGTVRKTKRSPEARKLLDRIKKILPDEPHRVAGDLLKKLEDDFYRLDSDYNTVSLIKKQFLTYEKRKLYGKGELPGFAEKVAHLSGDWQSHETEIEKELGVDIYEEGKRILEYIDAKDYYSEEMSLQLVKKIENDNNSIQSIEIKLKYAKDRAGMAWLEEPEDPGHDWRLRTKIVTNYPYLTDLPDNIVPDLINRARSLDKWVRGNDDSITPDVIEKIGQLLTQVDRDFVLTVEQRERVTHPLLPNMQYNLSCAIDVWNTYRERGGLQPPIYPRDLPLEYRRDEYLYLIDPSKVEITTLDIVGEFCIPEEKMKMKEDATKRLKAQQEKLEKVLAPILENNPNFKGFPLKELWRLCIDLQFQREDLISSFEAMDNDAAYYLEPDFINDIMNGVSLTLTQLGKKLTPEYYQWLHHECTRNIRAIWKKRWETQTEGKITRMEQGFRYLRLVCSEHSRPQFIPNILPIENKRTSLGFEETYQNYVNRHSGDPRYKDQGHPVGRVLSSEDPHLHPDSYTITPFTKEECKANAQCIFDKYYEEIDQTRRKIAAQHGQKEWNHDLVKNLSEEEKEEILTPIAHCYRELELSHLFWDGNGRLHNFCILNKLLLENDLPPAILDPAPWPWCHRGIKEILAAIRRGQELFESYKQPEIVSDHASSSQ